MSDFTRSIALVVGIDDYGNGIPPLRTARRDAERLAGMLAQQHGYDVRLLVDADATAERLLHLLTHELPAELQQTDRLLFYFAGHGVALDGDGGANGYLLPHDAKRGQETTYLHMPRIHDALLALECRHLLVILDACFSGAFRWSSTRDLISLPPVIHQERYDRFLASPAWQVITSSAADQKALDQLFIGELGSRGDDGGEHSPFAQVLFAALEGKGDVVPVAGGDGVITATELYLYLEDRLQPATMQHGLQQTPRLWPLKKHDKGEFIFLVPGHALNLPPAPPLSFENNPYLGLRSYDDADSDLFFGRTEVIRDLTEQVQQHALTVVVGASGTGKSSVVKAGLLHRLRKEANTTVLPVQRPGTAPLQVLRRLASALAPETTNPVLDDVAAFQHAVASWCTAHPTHRLVIVVDQFEELITQTRAAAERDALLQVLADALDSCGDVLRVICTLRSDFEPQLAPGALAPRWPAARYVIRPMTQDELREVIEQPASRRVLYFEPSSLVDDLINDVIATPGGLPLLSFALSEMYIHYIERRSTDRAITLDDYRAVGGVIGALRTRAETEFAALDAPHQKTMRRVVLRMVAPGDGEAARRRVPRSELAYDDAAENARVAAVIERLAVARLIVEDHEDSGEPYIEPAHDALVNAWDRLLGWIREENQQSVHDLRFQRRLGLAAREWALFADARNRDALLWRDAVRGAQLAQLQARAHDWLNQHERAFTQRSLRARRRTRMALTGTGILIVALAIGASVAAVFANRSAQRASDESAGARAALLGRTAAALPADEFGDSYGLRLLLAAEAVRLAASTSEQRRIADAENVIRELAPQYAGIGVTGYTDAFRRQEMPMLWQLFSPDGRWLLIGNHNALEAHLWDLGTTSNDSATARAAMRLVIDTVTLADDSSDLVAFREGRLVLLRQGQDGTQHRAVDLNDAELTIQPWTGTTTSLPVDTTPASWAFERVNDAPVLRHRDTGRTVVLPGAGDPHIVARDLAAATSAEGVGIWRLLPEGAERLYILPDAGEPVSWSADGQWLVTHIIPDEAEAAAEPLTGLPGRYAFWSLEGEPALVWSEPAAGWEAPVSSPDGRYFLRAGVRTHRLIDTRQLPRLQLLPESAPRITAGAWSPDGRAFVTGHEDGSIHSWLVTGGDVRRGPATTTAYGHVYGIRAGDDARWIVTLHPAVHAAWRMAADTVAFQGALDFDSIAAPPDELVIGVRQDGDPFDPLRGYEFRGDSLFAPLTRGRTGAWLLAEVNGATGALPRDVASRGSARTDTVSPDGRWRASGCERFSPDGRWLFLDVDRFFPTASLRRRNGENHLEASEQVCVVRPAAEPQAAPFLVHPDSSLTPPDEADLVGATTRTRFSPDGRWALFEANTHGESSCGYNEGVRLIDLHAPDPLVTVFTLEDVGAGRCPIIHFSSDGRWLAADDRLFDLTAAVPARESFRLPGFSLGFDPSSRMVAVHRGRPAGADPTSEAETPSFFAVLPLDPAALIRQACAAAGRNLTNAEWRAYFPREPYRAICPELPVPRVRE